MRSILILVLPFVFSSGCVGESSASNSEINELRLEITRLKVLLAESSAGAAFGACRSEVYNFAEHGADEPRNVYRMTYDDNKKLEVIEEYNLAEHSRDEPRTRTEVFYDESGKVSKIEQYNYADYGSEEPKIRYLFEYTCAPD